MSLRDFLLSILAITLLCWVAWATVLLYVDPSTAQSVGFAVFYGALFFALVGSFTLIGVTARTLFKRLHHQRTLPFRFVMPSVRQGVWFAGAVCASLILLSADLFNWWSILLLLMTMTILEGFFLLKTETAKKITTDEPV